MSGLTPIPTTRVSDLLARTRLTHQLQRDQLDLFRIQDQLSTGWRISVPSDDAPAALRAMTLQRLLERKEQVQTNLTTNQSFLAASDDALSTVSSLLADVRGAALGVAGTTHTDQQRRVVAEQVGRAMEQLVDIGNQQFRGRYLFAGSRTGDRPYDLAGDYVRFDGNERMLQSYSDIDVLFETNVTGGQVFGGISEPVQGTADLNPHLTTDTLLVSLRGGQGISPDGAIVVSDGTNSSTVDLSNASTIGDVAALIEANPPLGRIVTVEITDTGLLLSLDTGNLSITEVAGGNTAHELGIFDEIGVGTGPLVGRDLDPTIEKTTPIADLLGTKSTARFQIPGANNDLLIEATANGGEFDADVSLVAGGTAGSEVVTYAGGPPPTLTIQIEDGVSTAAQVVAAINAEGNFSARLDPNDTLAEIQSGTGTISVGPTVTLSGGSGIDLDRSGLQIANLGRSFTVDLTEATTVEDLLNAINSVGAGVLAEINTGRNGINLRSRISGADFSIGENGGATATELGLRTLIETTRLEDLNRGVGVPTNSYLDAGGVLVTSTDFTIITNDGTELAIDLDGGGAAPAESIDDVLELINGHPLNLGSVEARLSRFGNGIELFDPAPDPLNPPDPPIAFTVRVENQSQAAEHLGLVDKDAATAVATNPGDDPEIITGRDVNPHETESVFNTLVRLKNALDASDLEVMTDAIGRIEGDIDRVNYARSEVGARQQSLEFLQTRLENERVELKSALSLEIDVDLTEAISNLTARQVSLQASLQTAANLLRLSILDFI